MQAKFVTKISLVNLGKLHETLVANDKRYWIKKKFNKYKFIFWFHYIHIVTCDCNCRNPTLREVWGNHSHSRKWDLGVLQDSRKNSKHNCKGQNTSHQDVLYTIEKVLKCRCPKWPRMNHLDICSMSYGRKKGQKSNWQFDSRTLKVRNRPDPGVCRWIATHHWTTLKESYKFALDLVPIGGWGEKLWTPKVLGVQTGTVSGLHFWKSREKVPFICKCGGETHRILYGGRWWLLLSPGCGESSESSVARGLS